MVWTDADGFRYRIIDGLLSLHLGHYECNQLVEAIATLIRKLTREEIISPSDFAKIHRLSRIAYELTNSLIVTSVDKTDIKILSSCHLSGFQNTVLGRIMIMMEATVPALRELSDEEVLQAHEAVAAVHTTMQS